MSESISDPEARLPFLPFNRAKLTGREVEYMLEAVANGHISGDGPFTRRCRAWLERSLGVHAALLTTSCTHALELAALALRLAPGDEVILPSFTFVSTANAFALRGARPVFVEIRPDTLNLDERRIEEAITPRTRAIVPVHYAGVGCEMDAILELASGHGLAVVEDNAHGLGGRYRGRELGTLGELATLSFHETKNISCGEGGSLLVNDPELLARAEIGREKGTDRSRFLRGEVDKYSWVGLGSSYLPSDLLAAFLLAQLEDIDRIQADRRRVWTFYRQRLARWAEKAGVGLPVVPEHCEQTFHMFYLICPDLERRTALIAGLKAAGMLAVFHYVPLHSSKVGRRFGYAAGDLPITEDRSERLVRLPFYRSLDEADLERVCGTIEKLTADW
ncbi:MAG: dTDP-4-amino-4,6-dideoxygalactose transaminase [Holophagales bacterium]|nr:dTDP-4-amino-4,6-dideoxygalactose transaminase [Holophagales bacterium]